MALLLGFYADVYHQDLLQRTPMYYAVREGHYGIIKRLLLARGLPYEENVELLTLTEDVVVKNLIRKARFALFLRELNKPAKKYKQWLQILKFQIDRVVC